jgi:hypothetical protein
VGPDLGVAPFLGVEEAVERGVADVVDLDVAPDVGSGSDVGGAVAGGAVVAGAVLGGSVLGGSVLGGAVVFRGALVVGGCGVGSVVGSGCPDVGVADGVG